jgi:type II secretory ATPase GspE/PulE/Tfp pilus assembly ATPase PilB-like protein
MATQETPLAARTTGDLTPKSGSGSGRPLMASFVDSLVRTGIIGPAVAAKVNAAKQQGSNDRRSLIEVLQEDFGIAKDVLQVHVAQFYAFRSLELKDRVTRRLGGPDILKLMRSLPEPVRALATKHKVLPYDIAESQNDKLIIVTPNPSEREVAEVARSFSFKKFEVCFMKERDWDELWRTTSAERTNRTASAITDVVVQADDLDLEAVIEKEIARMQLLAVVDSALVDAIRSGASAIHFVPRTARKTEVLTRVDGRISSWTFIDEARADAVTAALKVRFSGMDRYDRLAVQEGLAIKSMDGKLVALQAGSMPIDIKERSGRYETFVVQIEHEPEQTLSLLSLGLTERQIKVFREVVASRSGLILLGGPTGSGKRTTIAALLREIEAGTSSVLAYEDGMKYAFDGVTHIRRTVKMATEDVLGRLSLYDPDCVILDDIRTRSQADAALDLASRGKLVFGTMSSRNIATALKRMMVLASQPILVTQATRIVHAQRAIGVLCPHCRELAVVGDLVTLSDVLPSNSPIYRSVGCAECGDGIMGKVFVHETVRRTPELDALFAKHTSPSDQDITDLIRKGGMPTLLDSVSGFVHEGKVGIEELIAVAH